MTVQLSQKNRGHEYLLSRAFKRIKQIGVESVTMRKVSMPYELKTSRKISTALECIKKRWPQIHDNLNEQEYPVFIFSAGWRSGSTLMQRLVVSSGEVSIWGEPLGDAAIIQRLAAATASISFKWPSDNYFENDSDLSDLSNKWIANLTPSIKYFRSSQRLLIKQWLGESAKEKYGVTRWGLKEVRLTIDHARYLKWLFPNARFIFIFRNLFHAYKSYRGNVWGSTWPGYFSWSPIAFARHWRFLLEGFLRGYKEVNGILVKFEDLISGAIDFDEIANHIGVRRIDLSVLNKKIGFPTPVKRTKKKVLTPVEVALLSMIGGPVLASLGYRP